MKFIAFASLLILCITMAFGADSSSSTIAGAEKLNATALQSMVTNSSSNLQSYRFMLEMDQRVELFDRSSLNKSPQVIMVKGFGQGSFNLTSKSMKMVLASLILPFGDEDNATAVALEEYLLNDTIYMKIDGIWTQMNLSIADLWTLQDKAGQQLELLNHSNITLLGIEMVDGQECYRIRLSPDMEAYSKIVSGQISGLPGTMNLSQIYRNSTMEITYWINKEDYLLKKTQVNMALNLTPQSLGIPPKGPVKQEIHQLTNTTLAFLEYNKAVSIKLPAQAKKAMMLPLNLNSSAANGR